MPVEMEYVTRVAAGDGSRIPEDKIKLSFCGDLLLLKDMIADGIDAGTGIRNYDYIFSYAKEYWKDSDWVVGVLEGPLAGEVAGWSNKGRQDLMDGGARFNFPDEFGCAIRNAGIDMVTTATNHLLDCEICGAYRTVDVLRSMGLEQVGCYRSEQEFNSVKIVDIKGLKIAFIAYTAWCNSCERGYFFEGEGKHVVKLIAPKGRPWFEQCRWWVKHDFEEARDSGADLIVALPHMGTEFSHTPDPIQVDWCRYFVECGADIVFAAHPHVVQPVVWEKKPTGEDALVIYCSGNFINSYTERDVDAGMIVDVYCETKTRRLFCADLIPVHSCRTTNGYCSLPVFDGIHETKGEIARAVIKKRLAEIHGIVTESAFGVRIPIDKACGRYRMLAGGSRVFGV